MRPSEVSDDMRFCSRCGFQLTGVAELLIKNESVPPAAGHWKRFPVSHVAAPGSLFQYCFNPIFLLFSFLFDSPIPLFGAFFFSWRACPHRYQWISARVCCSKTEKSSELASMRATKLPPAHEIPASGLFAGTRLILLLLSSIAEPPQNCSKRARTPHSRSK